LEPWNSLSGTNLLQSYKIPGAILVLLKQRVFGSADPFGETNLPLTRTDWYAEGAAGVRCNSEQAKAFPAR
jgi:hypothetical protein